MDCQEYDPCRSERIINNITGANDMNKDLLHSKVELFETGGEISYQGDANVAKFLLGGIGTGTLQ